MRAGHKREFQLTDGCRPSAEISNRLRQSYLPPAESGNWYMVARTKTVDPLRNSPII